MRADPMKAEPGKLGTTIAKKMGAEMIAELLKNREAPDEVAEAKGHATALAIVALIFGGIMILSAVALVVVPLLALEEKPGLLLIGFSGGLGAGGLWLVVWGLATGSGEGFDEAAKHASGPVKLIAAAVSKVRGKKS